MIHPSFACSPRVISAVTSLALASAALAESSAVTGVTRQANIGEMACGPCALYNSLALGAPNYQTIATKLQGVTAEDKVNTLIAQYGTKPSRVYRAARTRYMPEHGVTAEDMLQMVRDCLDADTLTTFSGKYLNRKKDDSQRDQLQEIHQLLRTSLEKGFPPIVEVRSFVARPSGENFTWQGLLGHYVTILNIQDKLTPQDKGFTFSYADSATGKREKGYIHLEEARNFTAARQFSVTEDGEDQWEWVTDHPYLLVQAPSLRLLTQKEPWHSRTLIILRYAITAHSKNNTTGH